MPKTARVDESDKGDGKILKDEKAATISNDFNDKLCKGFVADYEQEQEEIESIMEAARVQCQPHVDRLKEISKEAAECGIEKKAFKAKLAERSLLRRADAKRSTLSDRQREVFDRMSGFLVDDLFSYVSRKEEAEQAD
jgi:hypothetical protein